MNRKVIAAALGECVHVAGVSNFLRLAEQAGWETVFLGPAVPVEELLKRAKEENADLIGVSYRLTPETGERLLGLFAEEASELYEQGVRFAFGGTPPVAERAEKLGFFERIFDGTETIEDVIAFLKGEPGAADTEEAYPQTLGERITWKAPYPVLRHHFGLPTMEETAAGIRQIALAKALDVISLGTDQDAQENFFHPERQDKRRTGAGGVPVRSADDYRQLYAETRQGNYPLMRTYSGTDDFLRLAEIYIETINIAWCAIPLFWFNDMDGRGPLSLHDSIVEHQQVMAFYGERNIPVELNEPHHWGMRDATDVVFAASAYLSAYNARAFGVRDYIAQMMFNSPPGLSDAMDLAKMLAVIDLIEPLRSADFRIWKQTRTGLLSYPVEVNAARAQLAASLYLQMALKPHIVHIVGHTEAHHAATPEDVIEASLIARRAIDNAIKGAPDMTAAPEVQTRKEQIVSEVKELLEKISALAGPDVKDPLTDPVTLTEAVRKGLMDAPQLRNNRYAMGKVKTMIANGASVETTY